MNDFAKKIYQIMVDVWLNYKHHLNEIEEKGPDVFWSDLISDADGFDAKYRNDIESAVFYRFFFRALVEATKENLNARNDRH